MPFLKQTLHTLVAHAIEEQFGLADLDPLIQLASRLELGDYQANFALGLSKKLGRPPLEIAEPIALALAKNSLFSEVSCSGPGFINLRLSPAFLSQAMTELSTDLDFKRLKTSATKTIVIDYGSANVAKEMHVGHLRSAIIGDCLVKLFTLLGHTVIKQNHVGDWGTQFGMLIEYLIENNITPAQETTSDLNALYKQAKAHFDASSDFAARSRARVVALQSGDTHSLAIWQLLVTQSETYFDEIYRRLDVSLTKEDIRGESFYNSHLPEAIENLLQVGLARESEGAIVIDLPGFLDENGKPLPLLIRKSDGGYLYASTDLLAARFRLQTLKAHQLIYITDLRQKLHFQMLFAALRKVGWAEPEISLDYLGFGSILGTNKKPFKTRSGESIRLADLIDEAEKRARDLITSRDETLSEAEITERAHAIGVGALKYADLSSDLVKDYVFSWDHLLAFEGNTAPYLQNAYVRIQALFRKGQVDVRELRDETKPLQIETPEERKLAIKILGFADVLQQAAEELRPHKLCTYLYELAENFHAFYEKCPILNLENITQKRTRLKLAFSAAHVLKTGLGLLGISVLDRM